MNLEQKFEGIFWDLTGFRPTFAIFVSVNGGGGFT